MFQPEQLSLIHMITSCWPFADGVCACAAPVDQPMARRTPDFGLACGNVSVVLVHVDGLSLRCCLHMLTNDVVHAICVIHTAEQATVPSELPIRKHFRGAHAAFEVFFW